MKARWITLFVFILITNSLLAQTYTFKVLASKGKTEIKAADAWQTLKVGASLNLTDEIKIAENAYLGLMHASGKPLELKEAKSYKVSDLVERAKSGSSVLMKYTDFILSSNQAKQNRLSATGAVHRGVKDPIVLLLPAREKADLYGEKISLQWLAKEVTGPYEVIITNLMEEPLARFETSETQLMIAVNEGSLKNEPNFLVKVKVKGKPSLSSDGGSIKKLTGSDREKVATLVNEFSAALEENSALNKYVMAGFYEENLLINDALTAYQEAIKMAPDVDFYKEAYADFLTRLGFKQ